MVVGALRDRLIELIVDAENEIYHEKPHCTDTERIDRVADHLLAEGVIVPPVKVGQICYKVYMREILEIRVTSISYEPLPAFAYTIHFNSIGVLCLMKDGTKNEKYSWDIYITREEAEKALAERSEK